MLGSDSLALPTHRPVPHASHSPTQRQQVWGEIERLGTTLQADDAHAARHLHAAVRRLPNEDLVAGHVKFVALLDAMAHHRRLGTAQLQAHVRRGVEDVQTLHAAGEHRLAAAIWDAWRGLAEAHGLSLGYTQGGRDAPQTTQTSGAQAGLEGTLARIAGLPLSQHMEELYSLLALAPQLTDRSAAHLLLALDRHAATELPALQALVIRNLCEDHAKALDDNCRDFVMARLTGARR